MKTLRVIFLLAPCVLTRLMLFADSKVQNLPQDTTAQYSDIFYKANVDGGAYDSRGINLRGILTAGATQFLGASGQFVSSVTTDASLNETFTGVSGATVALSVNVSSISLPNSGVTAGAYTSANITVDSHGLISAAANGSSGSGIPTIYVASVTAADASVIVNTQGAQGSTVTVAVNVSSISLPNSSVGGAGSCTSCNLSYDTHGLITVAANGTGGGASVYPATSTIIATTAGISASTITVSSLTITGQINGNFNLDFDAAQAKLPGSAAPFISNSTGEFSASVYFDDTSTQSVTWTGVVKHYDGRALFADLIFTTTSTANFICWNVYTATNTPNSSTNNYDSSTYTAAVSTAIRVNSNQLALSRATVQLANTVTSNGDFLTIKVDRQTGGCGNTNSVGFGRLKKLSIYE